MMDVNWLGEDCMLLLVKQGFFKKLYKFALKSKTNVEVLRVILNFNVPRYAYSFSKSIERLA